MCVPFVFLHQLTRSLNIARARRHHASLRLHPISHELVVLRVSADLRIERDEVSLAHSSGLFQRPALRFTRAASNQVLRTESLIRVRVPGLRVLSAEVSRRLSWVLSLAVCVLLLTTLSESSIVPYSVHLRLLPVVERVRLQVTSISSIACWVQRRYLSLLGNQALRVWVLSSSVGGSLIDGPSEDQPVALVFNFTFLARPIHAHLARHSIMWLVVGILLGVDAILLCC